MWSDDTVPGGDAPSASDDDSDEFYTPAVYIEAARAVMGESNSTWHRARWRRRW